MFDGRPKKRYAQHFLQAAWADRLVDAIGPRPGDHFIEIGPGPGALTLELAPRVRLVTAIEADRDMVDTLRPRLPPNVILINEDFLETDLGVTSGGKAVRVAGNLPYNVSTPILFHLLDARKRGVGITDATLMLQREVAERLEADPGVKDFGVLTIFVRLRADVRRLLTLPPGAFRPAPAVHSAVVRLSFRELPVPIADEGLFEAMVRSMFTQRRKTLSNALKPFAERQGRTARTVLGAAGIDPVRRPETLQLAELARLADAFASTKT